MRSLSYSGLQIAKKHRSLNACIKFPCQQQDLIHKERQVQVNFTSTLTFESWSPNLCRAYSCTEPACQASPIPTSSIQQQKDRRRIQNDGHDEDAFQSYLDRQSEINADSLKNVQNLHNAHNLSTNNNSKHGKRKNESIKEAELETKRKQLLKEANEMTKSFYRICLRCTYLIRPGNVEDEKLFLAREEEQRQRRIKAAEDRKTMSAKERFEASASSSMTFEPPVDRENELSSRAAYYLAFIKESFGQEVDCLTKTIPWREQEVERFVFLMKQGEERRSWILQDYKFQDPFIPSWQSIDRKLTTWQTEASKLVQQTYENNGWLLQSELDAMNQRDDDDDDLDWGDDMIDDDNSMK